MRAPGRSEALRAIGFRALSYGFPLLTIPAFAGAMSPAEYGRLGLALTFCSVLQAIAEGGHTIAGARQLIQGDSGQYTTVVSRIYDQKLALLLICLALALAFHVLTGSSKSDIALFTACFVAVVVPDALTPVWSFQASGRVSELTRIQFLSRATALPIMLTGIWLWPSAFAAALLTGAPFLLCAVLALKATDSYRFLPGIRMPRVANVRDLRRDQILVFAGTMAATMTPALAMQTFGLLYGRADLGAVYLAIVLWLACRQLCGLVNQSAFRDFAMPRDRDQVGMADILAPARWGTAIAAGACAAVLVAGWLLEPSADLKYAETLRALPWMLGGLVLYSLGHAVAMNRFAARGRSGTFALVHLSSAVALVAVCFSAKPFLDRPELLGLATVAADATLLALAWLARRN